MFSDETFLTGAQPRCLAAPNNHAQLLPSLDRQKYCKDCLKVSL